jgi:hypothetical protein
MNDVVPFPGAARMVDGVRRPSELKREPGEALYDFLQRVARSREAEIERLNRIVDAQDGALAEARGLTAQRVRQIVYLETSVAVAGIGLILLAADLAPVARMLLFASLPFFLIGAATVFLARWVAKLRRWRVA